MATAAAIVGAAAGVASAVDQRRAAKSAARKQEQAAFESAETIATQSARAIEDLELNAQRAAQKAIEGAELAEQPLQRLAFVGRQALGRAIEGITSGDTASGPLANLVRQSALEADLTPFAATPRLIQKNAALAVQGATPFINQQLLAAGQTGLGALQDIAGIRQRGFESLADLAQQTGAAEASLLVGTTPELQQMAQGASEARVLGDVAGQRANTQITEQLAQLAGRFA